jgi:tripartite ATP-independent transporter DctM subunit
MTGFEIAAISVFAIVILVYFGLQVPLALASVSFVGVVLIRGDVDIAANLLFLTATRSIADFLFAAVPLFVLMGLLVNAAGMASDSYEVANRAFRKVAGGLGIATVMANAVFAAITGVSVASAAIFSRVSVPEMLKFGYSRHLAVGVVAGSSVLGMLIPPSILLIVYAILAEVSVGDMFLAGIIPGLLLTTVYSIGIWAAAFLWPRMAPLVESAPSETSHPRDGTVWSKSVPIAALVVVVLGGIYGGVFTPTESAAFGCVGALAIAVARGRLSLRRTWTTLSEAGMISASILLLILSATMYTRMLGVSGLPTQLAGWVDSIDLSYLMLIAIYILIIIVLGTIIDSISIMLIVVPIFLPIFAVYDIDPVWFGIVTTLAAEIGLLTPPMGIAVFVIKASLDDPTISLGDIFLGALPFAAAMLLVLALIIAFPVLGLPPF